jgi:hypothetical protein
MKVLHLIFLITFLFTSSPVTAEKITTESTHNDRVSLKVTIYNDNFGLIKDTRKVKLPSGEGWIRFYDIAAHIIPPSIYARSINYPDEFTVLEQHYEYDLINEDVLLDKYVGKKIKIINFNEFQDRKEVVEAILLSNNQGQIYKIKDEIYLGHPGYKILPELPEDLIAKPTLTWLYSNKNPEPHQLQVSYLTNNINWKADYILLINEEGSSADLSGWVSLDNQSGATYKDTALKLVAGKVHLVKEKAIGRAYEMMRAEIAATPQFEEKALGEYYVYDLKRKTTIKDKHTKQVNLVEAGGIEIRKELITRAVKRFFIQRARNRELTQPVNVYIKFQNSTKNNLGIPLPAGIMRTYKEDADGSRQFVGEDKIDHTPQNEEIKLVIGEAFDVLAQRIQTDYHKISSRRHASEWEVKVKNHKEKEVTVTIEEPLRFDSWKIIDSSHPYEKIDAFTIKFKVKISKNKVAKVKYRVEVGL